MDSVNKTLYIPLYGKALVSKKGVILQDKKAEEIWQCEQFPLQGKSRSKWLAYYTASRAFAFDEWLRMKITQHPEATVLHLGCGMDSRVERLGELAATVKWFDLDFPSVIEERKRYFQETKNYKMLGVDLKSDGAFQAIPTTERAIVVMEGVSMYLTNGDLQRIFAKIGERFPRLSVLVDCYTPFAVKMSKFRNPVKEVGVAQVFGVASPEVLEKGTSLQFKKGREITPKRCIDELRGIERLVFRCLYAGKLSKKLYKLYEYKK